MASRREFIQAGIAASVLPMVATAGEIAPKSVLRPLPLYKVVFDQRFPASVAFAGEMKRLGGPVYAIEGDITDLWFHDLHTAWKNGPVAIAGLTAHGPLFCLERLAWDHDMRVVFRAEHTPAPNGCVEHNLTGLPDMLREAMDLRDQGHDWSRRMAAVLTRCPETRSASSSITIVTPFAGSETEVAESLYSWVIAPKQEQL